MPEKANLPVFDKCNSCATSDGPGHGPLPTSHAEVCCLYRFARLGQSAPFLDEGSQKQYDYDSICEDCPSRLKLQQALQVGPVYQPPQRSSDAPQEGILALATGCEAAPAISGSQSKKRKKIEPRLRTGFKKLTLEIRPPRFKKKLWFGTYTEQEIDRARDAVNYYMGYNQPYNYPDSPVIFAEKPLKGIKFEDLLPSCDQFIQGGEEQELAYLYFARQVKKVIHSVTGKQKKSSSKKYKCKGSQKLQSLLKEAPRKLDTYDPIVPSAPGSTTSSDTQYVACDPTPEACSQLVAWNPSFLPLTEMVMYEEEITALLRSSNWCETGVFPLEEMFNFPSALPPYGESSTTEENGFPVPELWTFQNEGPSFPPQ